MPPLDVQPELQKEFEAFEHEHLSSSWTLKELRHRLKKQFPYPEVRTAYYDWVAARAREERTRARAPLMTRSEILHALDKMDYNDEHSRGELGAAMNRMIAPWLPVGRDQNGDFYRIALNPNALLPDQKPPSWISHRFISNNILGINTNVQPAIPAHDRTVLPEESKLVNENHREPDEGGFVFNQIGDLETWCNDNEDLRTLEDAGNRDWMKTHFAAVMRLSPRGEANDVYIVYDFYPDYNLTGDRSRRYPGATWGFFGETEM